MRCPDCGKFVAYNDEPDIETPDLEYSDGRVTGSVTRPLPCGECGTDLKSAELDIDLEVTWEKEPKEGCEHDFDISVDNCSPSSRVETKDRKGRPIKSARYMTTYYGVELSGAITCDACEAEGGFGGTVEAAASSFDEQV